METNYFVDFIKVFDLTGVDENGQPNEERMDSLERYKRFTFKKLGKL